MLALILALLLVSCSSEPVREVSSVQTVPVSLLPSDGEWVGEFWLYHLPPQWVATGGDFPYQWFAQPDYTVDRWIWSQNSGFYLADKHFNPTTELVFRKPTTVNVNYVRSYPLVYLTADVGKVGEPTIITLWGNRLSGGDIYCTVALQGAKAHPDYPHLYDTGLRTVMTDEEDMTVDGIHSLNGLDPFSGESGLRSLLMLEQESAEAGYAVPQTGHDDLRNVDLAGELPMYTFGVWQLTQQEFINASGPICNRIVTFDEAGEYQAWISRTPFPPVIYHRGEMVELATTTPLLIRVEE